MRRFVWIWLTLLGAFWAARTLVAAATFGRVDQGYGDLVQLVLIPAGQAAVLWWVTREVIHHLAEACLLRDLYAASPR